MTSDRIISNENDMSKETVAGDESGIIVASEASDLIF